MSRPSVKLLDPEVAAAVNRERQMTGDISTEGFLVNPKKRQSTKLLNADESLREKAKKYAMSDKKISTKSKDKRVRRQMERVKEIELTRSLADAANEATLTQTQGGIEVDEGETTYTISQEDILKDSDVQTNQKAYELTLDQLGPYFVDYTKNGTFLLLGGYKGHLATIEWQRHKLIKEFQVYEEINDVTFLHNETMFAVAQKNYTYIYDKNGVEMHCIKETKNPKFLQFLPYHFLLTIGNQFRVRYIDVSTGQYITEINTKQRITSMTQNPQNAIILTGNSRGVVSFWSPNQQEPAAKLLAHTGTIRSMAADFAGNYLVTSGEDGFVKVFDIRTFKILHQYVCHSSSPLVTISQTGLLAISTGKHIQIWKDALQTKQKAPYLHSVLPSSVISSIKFCPYEDFLGIGHEKGFKSIVVPGAGIANYDAYEANPYQTTKQRQESEVHALLEKLPAKMISLNTKFGSVDDSDANRLRKLREAEAKAANPDKKAKKHKNKGRGKNSSMKRYLKKNDNIYSEKRARIEKALAEQDMKEKKEKEKEKKKKGKSKKTEEPEQNEVPSALDIFKKND